MKTIRQGVIAATAILLAGNVFGQNPLRFISTKATVEQAIQLNWNSVTNGLYELDYADSLSGSPTQWKPLYINYASQGTNTLFLDAGVYYQGETVEHPRNFPQRFYRVIQTGTNQTTPPGVTITSPTNNFVASGLLNINVSYSSSIPVAQIHIFVDGEEVRVAGDSSETNFVINTCEWPNGPHSLYAVVDGVSGIMSSSIPSGILLSSGVSPFVQVQFNNFISSYNFSQSWFQPPLGQTQNISAKFALLLTGPLPYLTLRVTWFAPHQGRVPI